MKRTRVKRVIKIQINTTGGPYPHECWWKIIGSNGRIFVHSETMGKKNAKKSIARIIDAIKRDMFEVVEVRGKKTYPVDL